MPKFLVAIKEESVYLVEAADENEAFHNVRNGEKVETNTNIPELVSIERYSERYEEYFKKLANKTHTK